MAAHNAVERAVAVHAEVECVAPAHDKVGAVNDEVERVVAVHYKEEAVDAHDAVELVHDLPMTK